MSSHPDHANFRPTGALTSVSGSYAVEDILTRRTQIRTAVLRASRQIQSPNFLRASANDLRRLFDLYDAHFFDHLFARSLPSPCTLAFSGRLRSSGGMTHRLRARSGAISYRITISTPLLFDNFKDPAAAHVVAGVECADRLDALMRIMEHEMLHLYEYVRFDRSNCAAARFQQLAKHYFGHTAHRHSLTTSRQRTLKQTTFRPGAHVAFIHDGQPLRGIVNRITRRATVLVEHPRGVRYTDGKRYAKFYVPLTALTASSLQ